MIQDSGERREFESGAVRDIQEGKGRCDLLPLVEIGTCFTPEGSKVLNCIESFKRTGETKFLCMALNDFSQYHFEGVYNMALEVAIHYEEGAKKYAERNWEKGIPTHCYIDSATRHLLKFMRGDSDERHDRAFAWNLLCCLWTCNNKPELNDYPIKEE